VSAPADSPRFYRCLPITLRHEGGWSEHPADPGGATNQGITIETFRHHFGAERTKQDLREIAPWQVRYIYRYGFWLPCRCDELPPGVDLAVFDGAVNSGPARSVKWLQSVVGTRQDGIIGPLTLQRVSVPDPRDIILDLCDVRMRYLRRLSTWQVFGRGWERRVTDIQRDALAMARGEHG
jgi:lysozyme family protein